MTFSEAWEVENSPNFPEPYQRCGPEGEPAHPHCSTFVGGGQYPIDVEVDQATGNIYAFNAAEVGTGKKYIVEYSPGGAKEITRFGEETNLSTAESPEKIHGNNGIAVDGAGDVYVSDVNRSEIGKQYNRLMVFRPQSPSDFEHYVYAGEVEAGLEGHSPAVDVAGHVYVVSGGQANVEEYASEAPAAYPAPSASRVCRFTFAKHGIVAMTVDPANGEVFFYSNKTPKRVYRLGACDEATKEFTGVTSEPEAFGVAPERASLSALVFDPVRQLETSRAPGVLYGGAPGAFSGLGEGEPGQSSLGYIFSHSKEVPPSVEAESVSNVGAADGVLHASVDPHGFDTRYRFQFLTVTEYEANPVGARFAGASEAPVGGGVVKGGSGVQSVAATVGGLVSDMEYRYRLVATSECASGQVCEGTGETQEFRTFPDEPAGLPDHRVYELVSPMQKNGGQVWPAEPEITSCGVSDLCKPGGTGSGPFPMQAASDGNSIAYEGSPFSAGEGAIGENEYLARARTTCTNGLPAGCGWSTCCPVTQKPNPVQRSAL